MIIEYRKIGTDEIFKKHIEQFEIDHASIDYPISCSTGQLIIVYKNKEKGALWLPLHLLINMSETLNFLNIK